MVLHNLEVVPPCTEKETLLAQMETHASASVNANYNALGDHTKGDKQLWVRS